MEREEEAGDSPRLLAELRPLIQCHHHILQWQELLYLGDERLPAGQAEQPGGHQLVGLHIHQVEVDEFAPSPPWPHTDVQVLNAIGREEEGTARIHLWNNTWRYSHPQRLITALESPAWSINYIQLLLKTCTPILPLLNPIPPRPRNTLGLIHARKEKSHSGTPRASPAHGFHHTGFAWGAFAFPLQDSNGVFLPFTIHISNYQRTNSKEIESLQTVSLTQIICPPGFRANDPTHDSSNQKIIITNALRLSVVHSSAWVAF